MKIPMPSIVGHLGWIDPRIVSHPLINDDIPKFGSRLHVGFNAYGPQFAAG